MDNITAVASLCNDKMCFLHGSNSTFSEELSYELHCSTMESPFNLSDGFHNTSKDAYLKTILGPKQPEFYKLIPVTVIYCLIFVTGLVGNVCTCIVIARNQYMHTATNYYLFNLAIADLLVLVLGLPQETYSLWSAYPWIFGEAYCIVRTMAAETSTYASILTITSFTMERYVAICHPMRAKALSSLKRAVKVIIILWILSALCAVPIVMQYGIVYVNSPSDGRPMPESALCNIRQDRYLKHIFEAATILFFLMPMTVISVFYVLIGLAIRRSVQGIGSQSSQSSRSTENPGTELRILQQAQARRAVLKMLVAVVVAFFVCWAPFHAQRLIVLYVEGDTKEWTAGLLAVQNVLYFSSGIFYYISSVINPILYNIMSLKFRQAFRNTILRPCCRKKNINRQTLLKRYRFHSKLPGTDTNMTLVHLQANGLGKYAHKAQGGKECPDKIKYIPGRACSGESGASCSGSSPAVVPSAVPVPDCNCIEEFSGDNDAYPHFHSYNHTPKSHVTNYCFRQYHSYA